MSPEWHARASALGVDVEAACRASHVEDRARVARLLEGITTRSGTSRSERIRSCGTLCPAEQGGEYGLAHRWCGDRACPVCARRRQRTEALHLRRYARARIEAGATLIFPTLTQIKLPWEHESAETAIARLYASRRELLNTKTKGGRALRRYFVGGIWAVEATWSPRGIRAGKEIAWTNPSDPADVRRYRAPPVYVAYSGYHPHLHGILELAPAPEGRSPAGWAREAMAMLERRWLEINPEASCVAQKIQVIDENRVAQVTKYPLEPFSVQGNPVAARHLIAAMAERRTIEGWGDWKSWKRDAAALLEKDRREAGDSEPLPIHISDTTFAGLVLAAEICSRVQWSIGDRIVRTERASVVLDAIRRDPRILQARGQPP